MYIPEKKQIQMCRHHGDKHACQRVEVQVSCKNLQIHPFLHIRILNFQVCGLNFCFITHVANSKVRTVCQQYYYMLIT
jgi:hypothetical protein